VKRTLAALVVLGLVACGGSQVRSEEPQHEPAPADTGPPDAGPPPAPLEEDAGVASVETAPDAEVASADAGLDSAPVEAETTGPVDDAQVALVARGRRAYTRVCENCHEDGPRIVGRHFPEARVRQQVRQGGRRMRAIPPSRLSESDLVALCAFLAAR
jgi:mono/diheme cytochrome c family protein